MRLWRTPLFFEDGADDRPLLSVSYRRRKPSQQNPLKHHSCRWCQRETGAAFALHALIEADRLKVLKGEIEWNTVPTESGVGQCFARCSKRKIALWSIYNPSKSATKANGGFRCVDVGTLDNPDAFPPDVHLWTSSKQPWVMLSDKVPAYPDAKYCDEEVWSKESLERRRKILPLGELE